MAADPKARMYSVSFGKGTVTATLGLLQYLFDVEEPSWSADSSATTERGRRRYKYGTRQRSNAAPGKQVMLDLGEDGVFSCRVTGPIVDFISEVVSKAGSKVKKAYTRRGTVYAPTIAPLS